LGTSAIEIKNLTKIYKKRGGKEVIAINDLNFTVNKGEIFGLLGPNGAGKTTTLRIISTILKPTSGDVVVEGVSVTEDPDGIKKIVGFLTGETRLYERLTPRETFYYFGRLYNMKDNEIEERIKNINLILKLEDIMDRRISELSDGMKQKVSIGRTIIHNPEVFILDEPLTGLDIFARRSVAKFIRRSKSEGKTILLSTHVMSEVEELCDSVGFLYKGKLLEVGGKEEIKKRYECDTIEKIFMDLISDKEENEKNMDYS